MKFRMIIILLLMIYTKTFASEASFVSNGLIWLVNDDNTGLIQLTETPRNNIWSLKWSPDGRKLAYISNLGLEMIDMESNTNMFLGSYHGRNFDWSPDGTKIVNTTGLIGDNDGALYVINVEDPSLSYQLVPPMSCQYPYWSHDGSKIAFSSRNFQNTINNGVYIVDADGQNLYKLNYGWRSWGWTYDDSYLFISNQLTSSAFTDLLAYDLSLNNTTHISDSVRYSRAVSLSPTGHFVAYTIDHFYEVDGSILGVTEAMICDIGSNPIGFGWSQMYNPYETFTSNPQWAPGGDKFAYMKQTPYGHSIHIGELNGNSTELIEHNGGIEWSPDGRTILSGSYFIDIATSSKVIIQAPASISKATWRPSIDKSLTLKDGNDDALSDKEFYLIRVANDAPLFTPDTLGIVKTDADGKIHLTPVQ